MPDLNRQVLLKARPQGVAQAEHFEIRSAEVPPLTEGQVLVKNHYLSVEPAMRGWIADAGNYSEPIPIGSVMRSFATGEILASEHADFKAGEFVTGWFGWQEFAAVDPTAITQRTTKDEAPLTLGILGINGLTAYLALTLVGQPRPGDTVVVSTAAGAVGSAVGQIARNLGCRTIGIAGGPEKVALCRTLFGYEEAIDYKAENVEARIKETCPDGVDVYFDNTSGPISDAIIPHLSNFGRVVVCGTAAIQRWDEKPQGPRVERHLLVKRARMEGFVIFDHEDKFAAAREKLRQWIADGQLTYREDILDGLESCPDALAGIYRGENQGKRLIRLVSPD